MGATYTEWAIQLENARTGNPIDDDSGKFYVLTAGSAAQATIYSDQSGTAITQPCTLTDGKYRFFTATSVTSVDITGVTALGQAFFVDGLLPSNQKIFISNDQISQVLFVPLKFEASAALVDTGFDLPAKCLINACLLKVTVADAGETIEVGFDNATEGGDLDGLINAAPLDNLGVVELRPQITSGTNIDYVGTDYRGALLATIIAGADAVATVGGSTDLSYLTDGTIKSIVYTPSSSDTFYGFAILKYDKLPT
jgi:hypothetical protein